MSVMLPGVASDVEAVMRLSVVSAILEVVCKATGMGFAAIARVTDDRWIACGVRDEIQFGLLPGGELVVGTTLCGEVRQSGRTVIIEHVEKDAHYCMHPTPSQYGFQSYISQPIIRRDGRFFGTLCAIDPSPAILNSPAIVGMFRRFAQLIALHLDAAERLPADQVSELEESTGRMLSGLLDVLRISGPARDREEVAEMLLQSGVQMDALISTLESQVSRGSVTATLQQSTP